MRVRAIVLPLFAGLALVVIFLLGVTRADMNLVTVAESAAGQLAPLANIAAQEASLNPGGAANEINVGPDGLLWISDFGAHEIWQVNPATAAYTVFHGMVAPNDARVASTGYVYWGAGEDNQFGRLDPDTGEASWWTLPHPVSLFGTQIDAGGDFWAVANFDPYLYRYNPAEGILCSYVLPDNGVADYPLAFNGDIWLGDWINGRLLILDPDASSYSSYQLPTGSGPEGMTVDGNGNIWWADLNLGQLARFQPTTNTLTRYTLPTGMAPEMITIRSNLIWYSEQTDRAIGRLNPATTTGDSSQLTATNIATTPICSNTSPSIEATLTITKGVMSFSGQNYSTLVDTGSWTIYQLPSGADPWGVVSQGSQIWFVDTGRQVLGRIPQTNLVNVIGCKLEDADGDEATTSDRTPIKDWPLDLRINGVAQGQIQNTSQNGCTTWADLIPGPAYGVEETLPGGWIALGATSHDFEASQPSFNYWHSFVNTEYATVTACKVEDADGLLATDEDRSAVQNWAIDLTIDGVAQGSTQYTDSNGCTTWSGLNPSLTYGVVEELPAGWQSLNGTNYQFDPASSGAKMSHTFINSQGASATACKINDADGKMYTTDDRTPIENWEIYLTINSVRQEPAQLTGSDGCISWLNLELGNSYGLEEIMQPDWNALTIKKISYGPATSGSVYHFDFINTQADIGGIVYLPMIIK